jgi:t-SNARE complex subunit (syntaxin)
MQEVNELLNEMSEFYDESEETSDLIEERLAKTINTSQIVRSSVILLLPLLYV